VVGENRAFPPPDLAVRLLMYVAHQATTLKPRLEGLGKVGLEVVVHHLVEHSLWGMWPQLVHTQLWSVGDTRFPSIVTVHLSFTEADCGGNTTAILIVFSTDSL